MSTTVKRMNILLQKRKARLDMRVPAELKQLVIEKSKASEIDYTTFMMVAALEKIEREEALAS
jgi:uncharacterized protein (DUF1778 family)